MGQFSAGIVGHFLVGIKNLGFSYNTRTNWPLKVTFKKLKSDGGDNLDALTTTSKRGDNYGYMELNENLIENLPRLRVTAGHEYFHIVQSFYDARWYQGFGGKGVSPPPNYWLNEAAAAWIEEKFSDQNNYIPEVRGNHNSMAPLNGLHQEVDAQSHGYGASAVIKFLVNKYGENILIKMYNDLFDGKHTLEAVCQYNPDEWWELFLQEYLLSNVYSDVGRANWFTNSSGEFNISNEADSLKTFIEDYQDLSGKLFRIIPKFANIDSKAGVVFSISGAEKRYLQLFRYKAPSTFEFLSADYNKVIFKDIKSLSDNGWLIALVSNNRYTNPYNEMRKISLEVRIENSESKENILTSNRCVVKVHFNGHYKQVDKDNVTTEFDREDYWGGVVEAVGSFSGNTFIGNYSRTLGSSNYSGTVVVTLNNDLNLVTVVNFSEDYTSYWQNNVDATAMSSFSGTDIPKSELYPKVFTISGNQTCSHLSLVKFNYQNQSTLINQNLEGFSCTQYSYLTISFRVE